MKQLGVHHLKFDNFCMTKRRFKHFKAFKCHNDFWGKVIRASATVIIGRKQKCKVENSLQATGQINQQSKDWLRMRNFNFPNIKHHASILLKFNHICHHCFSLVCTVLYVWSSAWAGNPTDDGLHFLLVPRLLFTVLVCCLLAALDLTRDTKDHRDALLDYEDSGYSAVVLFRNNLCRSAPADGC